MRTFLAAVLLSLAASSPGFEAVGPLEWRPVFRGVERADATFADPRPLRLHAARIDLAADGVRVCVDDDNGDRPDEVDGLFTTTFLESKGCQVAINATPFGPGRMREGETQDISGLQVSRGVVVSPVGVAGEPDRAALLFRNGRAVIETPPFDLTGVRTAIGGFGVVLRHGEAVRDETAPQGVIDGIHPRTAVGIADNGATLLLVVIDGRQPGYSEGVTLEELGEIFGWLGAGDALNLDGGGTTSMAIDRGKGVTLVNQPIDGGVVGQQRVGASHLGIFARPLPAPTGPNP